MPSSNFKTYSLSAAIALGLALPVATEAAFDAFYKIDTIPGESTDHKHEGWIQILAWSWKTDDECFGDFEITKEVDSSTAKLQEASASGRSIGGGELVIYRASQDPREREPYLSYRFKDLIVTSISANGNPESEKFEEEVQFSVGDVDGVIARADGTGGERFVMESCRKGKP